MNNYFDPRSVRWLLLFALSLGCLPVFAALSWAADGSAVGLQANFIFEFASDRARFLQASLVFVAFGIALLWWRR